MITYIDNFKDFITNNKLVKCSKCQKIKWINNNKFPICGECSNEFYYIYFTDKYLTINEYCDELNKLINNYKEIFKNTSEKITDIRIYGYIRINGILTYITSDMPDVFIKEMLSNIYFIPWTKMNSNKVDDDYKCLNSGDVL